MTSSPRVHTLANGVRVVCDRVPGVETFALSVVAGRGARLEDEARNGWSHLLEHMVFKGAGARSAKEIVEVIEAAGGQINAATGYERTSFQVRALAATLPLAIAVTADLVQRPTLDPDDLEREKQVVAQEIAEAADTPDDQVFELAQSAAFTDQSLGRPVLGSVATLASADRAALEAWRAVLYAPHSLVVSVAGAVEEEELLRLAQAAFGAATNPDSRPAATDPAQFTGGVAIERRRLEQAHLVFLLPAPSLPDPGYWPLRVFAEALGGGMSSRLFQKVREEMGLAYNIDAYADGWVGAGVLGVYAGCAAPDAARLAQAVAGEIIALGRSVGEAELARAKSQLKAGLLMSRESLSSRAEQAAAQLLLFDRLVPPAEFVRAIDAVTAADLAGLAETLRGPRRLALAALGPKSAAAAAPAFEAALFA
ncbi:MAG TPA: pitrilysin family protein [Caulobacteraceae bacterium]|jgi:predicted Zn-dependent peptidase|nr:pitrilysin family protein [Caulobacteraceae bacterium]